MSASQIPNLNTLRRDSGRGYSGARGGLTDNGPRPRGPRAGRDRVVQDTDNDANVSRLSAVGMGYLEDPFAKALTSTDLETRRLPIINRGTYVRTTAIDNLVNQFLGQKPEQKKQIISLGAGSDTRALRLLSSQSRPEMVYHDIDFAANTAVKIRVIRSTPRLQQVLGIGGPEGASISDAGDALHSTAYHIHPLDLRTLKPSLDTTAALVTDQQKTFLQEVDTTLPTLLISECCLVYLSPREAADVVSFFTQTLFPSHVPLGLILYEPIRPYDAFGRTMVSNLAMRGIQLQTLHQYASLGAQRQRLRNQGFDGGQAAADMHFIWEQWVSEAEKERVAGLEMLDEMEEWNLLAQHYCVAWAWREGIGGGFEGWEHFPSQEE